MPQYLYPYNPISVGATIDPEILQAELERVAKAHNTHEPQDFSASCITSAVLVDPNSYFTIQFGIRGSWNMGAVAGGTILTSMGAPVTGMVLCGGYAAAESMSTAVSLDLYNASSLIQSVSFASGAFGSATALSTLVSSPSTLTADAVLSIKLKTSATISMRDAIFHLKAYCPHKS